MAKKTSKEVERYIVGFMFIILGVFIVSAVSYIASVIPEISFQSTKPDPYSGNPPGSLLYNTELSLNNVTSINVNVGNYTEVVPWGNQIKYYIVVDISGINANITSMTARIAVSSDPNPAVESGTTQITLKYKCNYVVGEAYIGFTGVQWYAKLLSIDITFNTSAVGRINFYLYKANTTDPLSNLTCTTLLPSNISNKLFINFIGWAFGVMFVAIGITRLGIRL